ncbi:hypothetical protein LEP1GSC185_2927 [Leptospira licerasiae serovar Varillal str. VAR 010]|uniref:Transposase n=1 Tax=Leptospira licerasiae str. MMD4847 TaxID=1049971 RepID=A0ABN0H9Z3_9LEPT|nr:hypothetical protein LEP1GSC185_2927 [Leptospira licerasiae serovar Varillal str. VAR 010]EJZ42406.1 hypothetical protein LEP1GSC178_2544 [Leptospira licerasiae str. MMD4847]
MRQAGNEKSSRHRYFLVGSKYNFPAKTEQLSEKVLPENWKAIVA